MTGSGWRRLFRIPRRIYGWKWQISQIRSRRSKIEGQLHKKETTYAQLGRTIESKFCQTVKKRPRPDLDTGNKSRPCFLSN